MRIHEVIVSARQEEHIWVQHGVTPEEAEEVCLNEPLVIRGRDRSYTAYGQSESGRYLIVFLYPRGKGVFSLATAREMTDTERRRYQRSKGR